MIFPLILRWNLTRGSRSCDDVWSEICYNPTERLLDFWKRQLPEVPVDVNLCPSGHLAAPDELLESRDRWGRAKDFLNKLIKGPFVNARMDVQRAGKSQERNKTSAIGEAMQALFSAQFTDVILVPRRFLDLVAGLVPGPSKVYVHGDTLVYAFDVPNSSLNQRAALAAYEDAEALSFVRAKWDRTSGSQWVLLDPTCFYSHSQIPPRSLAFVEEWGSTSEGAAKVRPNALVPPGLDRHETLVVRNVAVLTTSKDMDQKEFKDFAIRMLDEPNPPTGVLLWKGQRDSLDLGGAVVSSLVAIAATQPQHLQDYVAEEARHAVKLFLERAITSIVTGQRPFPTALGPRGFWPLYECPTELKLVSFNITRGEAFALPEMAALLKSADVACFQEGNSAVMSMAQEEELVSLDGGPGEGTADVATRRSSGDAMWTTLSGAHLFPHVLKETTRSFAKRSPVMPTGRELGVERPTFAFRPVHVYPLAAGFVGDPVAKQPFVNAPYWVKFHVLRRPGFDFQMLLVSVHLPQGHTASAKRLSCMRTLKLWLQQEDPAKGAKCMVLGDFNAQSPSELKHLAAELGFENMNADPDKERSRTNVGKEPHPYDSFMVDRTTWDDAGVTVQPSDFTIERSMAGKTRTDTHCPVVLKLTLKRNQKRKERPGPAASASN